MRQEVIVRNTRLPVEYVEVRTNSIGKFCLFIILFLGVCCYVTYSNYTNNNDTVSVGFDQSTVPVIPTEVIVGKVKTDAEILHDEKMTLMQMELHDMKEKILYIGLSSPNCGKNVECSDRRAALVNAHRELELELRANGIY